MPRTTGSRPQRRILEATIAAGFFGAAPSVLYAIRLEGLRGAWGYGLRSTRAIGTLVPPGRPGVIAGTATHFAISTTFGQVLGRFLPHRHSAMWGAAAGAVMGLLGVGVVGRRSAAIRDLDFGAQLADNVAFGVIFALVADRASRPTTISASQPIRRSGFGRDTLRPVPHPLRGLVDRSCGGVDGGIPNRFGLVRR